MIDIAKKAHNLKVKYTQTRQLTTDTFNELVDLFVQSYQSTAKDSSSVIETPESIRNKLQELLLNDRLDASAIKNIPGTSQLENQQANTVLASPDTYNGLPTFRTLVHRDLPLLTGFVSEAGQLSFADTLLSALQKLDGNILLKAPIQEPIFIGNVTGDTFTGSLLGNADTATNVNWSGILSTPTTLVGYGITDAEPAFSKNTAFNKDFGVDSNTVAQGNDERILNGQIAYNWGNHSGLYQFVDKEHIEQLIGDVDGVNRIFTTSVPFKAASFVLYLNGVKERFFVINSTTQITFDTAPKNDGFLDIVEASFTAI